MSNTRILLDIVQSCEAVPRRHTGLRVQAQRRVYRLILLQCRRRRIRHAQLRQRAHGYRRGVRQLIRLRQAQHA